MVLDFLPLRLLLDVPRGRCGVVCGNDPRSGVLCIHFESVKAHKL